MLTGSLRSTVRVHPSLSLDMMSMSTCTGDSMASLEYSVRYDSKLEIVPAGLGG
jgi:hypothetical protein